MSTRKEDYGDPEMEALWKRYECLGCCGAAYQPEIMIRGYSDGTGSFLCLGCATELARILLEDLSAYTHRGRYGDGDRTSINNPPRIKTSKE